MCELQIYPDKAASKIPFVIFAASADSRDYDQIEHAVQCYINEELQIADDGIDLYLAVRSDDRTRWIGGSPKHSSNIKFYDIAVPKG
jgi:hypothetical protein